jgi:hypothetical protein
MRIRFILIKMVSFMHESLLKGISLYQKFLIFEVLKYCENNPTFVIDN